jgi:cytidyltransferase-like protein
MSSSETVPRQRRIGVYTGSFDPWHAGHQEAVELALKHSQLDHVLVFPDRGDSSWKPKRTPDTLRIEMLQELFHGDDAHVRVVSKLTVHEWLQTAEARAATCVGILGSDNVVRLQHEKKALPLPSVVEWLFVPRSGAHGESAKAMLEPSTMASWMQGKLYKLVPAAEVKHQHLSSTLLRQRLSALNPGWLVQDAAAPLPADWQVLFPACMDIRLLKFVRRNLLFVESAFLSAVCRQLNAARQFADVKLMSLESQFQGLSGDYVLRATIQTAPDAFPQKHSSARVDMVTHFVKVLTGSQAEANCARELNAVATLNALTGDRQHSRLTPGSTGFQESPWFITVTPCVPGLSLLNLMEATDAGSIAWFPMAAAASLEAGMAYGDLHQLTEVGPPASTEIEARIQQVSTLLAEAEARQKHMGNVVDFASLRTEAAQVSAAFRASPGTICWTHGDAAPGNVMYDGMREKAICLIDLRSVRPGFAAYEFFQALTSFRWARNLKRLDAVTTGQIEILEARFARGYKLTHPIKADAAASHAFFAFLWKVRALARS